ncbi:hypothetical protein [Bacteroides pyogenes]|jgi:hypothetical protein|uniref:Uncharacterized protein n=1 Tax=Bacteroides pyogenes TaxID=310300 RepID=A0A5D3EB63_9BACE|nr:hypothetical protein [Bacteroides pyogenes]TYK32851.1 hypothetical protein FNJ60_10600 [Bacteroides pyogenes]
MKTVTENPQKAIYKWLEKKNELLSFIVEEQVSNRKVLSLSKAFLLGVCTLLFADTHIFLTLIFFILFLFDLFFIIDKK